MTLAFVSISCSNFKKAAAPGTAPVVVATSPENGSVNVSPSLSEITVTFDQEMMTNQSWSWVMESEETFPKINGEVHYMEDRKTCVAPVKLEPGKTYRIWFNSQNYNNFKSKSGTPATPALLEFTTAKELHGLNSVGREKRKNTNN